ncbi:hypothetical protein A9G44_07875 [Gilliamella sp. Occ4-3]|nr:hypothetical protein A9G44_07875 [Gilliamella apicola]
MQYCYSCHCWWIYILNFFKNNFVQAFSLILFVPSKVLLMSLLLLSYSLESQALTATTINAIRGSAPYLTFDDGVTKVTKTEDLLGIKLSDGRIFTPQSNSSSLTNPIELPVVGQSFIDINLMVPASFNSVNFSELVALGNWGDDDGDGQRSNEVTATGNISLKITDKYGQGVSRSDTLNICKAPYKLSIATTDGSLTTRYGVPNTSTFTGGEVEYYITPKSTVVICFARPNMAQRSGEGIFAGPVEIWDSDKGFLTQSFLSSQYKRNFPTTGADGLYFDLEISGSDQALTWPSVTHEGITATMSNVTSTSVRVTLTGPQAKGRYPSSQITKPNLPHTFVLEGRDSSDNVVVKYGFELQKWFASSLMEDVYSKQESLCHRIGYRMPHVRDLTNSVCSGIGSGTYCQGAVGAIPSSSNNRYQRQIGAGLLTEWGNLHNYRGAFEEGEYWTSDELHVENQVFTVYTWHGSVQNSDTTTRLNLIACVYP